MLETVREFLPTEVFTEDALLPHVSGERALDRNNLRQALVLMEAAGFTSGDDGLLRDANGDTLDIEFLETRQSFDRIITPYVENLERLGVNITYNRVDPSQYQARTQENDFDMMFSYYVNGRDLTDPKRVKLASLVDALVQKHTNGGIIVVALYGKREGVSEEGMALVHDVALEAKRLFSATDSP